MIENEVIVSKLQSEGIDEKLAVGISFETQEALDAWVGTAKTFTAKPKDITEYTEDELKKLADGGTVKTLQALLDKARSKTAEQVKPADTVISPELAEIKAAIAELNAGIKTTKEEAIKAKFDAYVETKTKGFDPLEVTMLKSSLPITATSAEIDIAADKYRQLMVGRGLKSYATSSSSSTAAGELNADWSKAIKGFSDSKKLKK